MRRQRHSLSVILEKAAAIKPFDGLTVLLLEDEYLIAMDAEQILRDLGVNLALLDVNINGEKSFPIAEAFRTRGTPVVFARDADR